MLRPPVKHESSLNLDDKKNAEIMTPHEVRSVNFSIYIIIAFRPPPVACSHRLISQAGLDIEHGVLIALITAFFSFAIVTNKVMQELKCLDQRGSSSAGSRDKILLLKFFFLLLATVAASCDALDTDQDGKVLNGNNAIVKSRPSFVSSPVRESGPSFVSSPIKEPGNHDKDVHSQGQSAVMLALPSDKVTISKRILLIQPFHVSHMSCSIFIFLSSF